MASNPFTKQLVGREELDREGTRREACRFFHYFPDCLPACKAASLEPRDHAVRVGYKTPICRVLYAKHVLLFALGGPGYEGGEGYRERLFLKANRVGGTEGAAFEVTCHLTGLYPHWWTGKRFPAAGEWWAAGRTAETTRDIMQLALWGPHVSAPKTGMLPGYLVTHHTTKTGTPNALDTIWVRHTSGATSSVQFKSFAAGRAAFEGTAKAGIWLDEECEEDVAGECALRTMTTDGILLYTFTPLQGLTPMVENFINTADMVTPEGEIVKAKETFWEGKTSAA